MQNIVQNNQYNHLDVGGVKKVDLIFVKSFQMTPSVQGDDPKAVKDVVMAAKQTAGKKASTPPVWVAASGGEIPPNVRTQSSSVLCPLSSVLCPLSSVDPPSMPGSPRRYHAWQEGLCNSSNARCKFVTRKECIICYDCTVAVKSGWTMHKLCLKISLSHIVRVLGIKLG